MTDRSRRERTIGGLAGKVVGKAKEALASATGNSDLAREGRLQEAQADTEPDARHASVQAGEREARADVAQRQATVEAERTGAQRSLEAAEQVRVAATQEANRLEREAREAERRADHVDPEKDK